ncbi:hypothetical protein [Afifella sp. IM 167]|uniref:hypothetical protein n=1 Tax=Afifella sp. IM 167 TaxID=2033586 RepID=UPI001CCB003A|nr:hypothetical protein [Afifella sp. IM 167]MBZ8135075.1 hypothetical protein [Afifella sp. IM 167]
MKLAFDLGYHGDLTEAANDDILDQQQLGFVVAANIAQDLLQTQSCVHFDNCDFPGGISHIADEWNVIDQLADKHPDVALGAFGALLHTMQDFYAHSNWIELHRNDAAIPVWNQKLSSLPAAIVSGTWWIGSPKLCGPNAPSHSDLNKDSPTSREGSKLVAAGPNAGKSLFDLAYATALEATREEFARFSAVRLAPLAAGANSVSPLSDLIAANEALRDIY